MLGALDQILKKYAVALNGSTGYKTLVPTPISFISSSIRALLVFLTVFVGTMKKILYFLSVWEIITSHRHRCNIFG